MSSKTMFAALLALLIATPALRAQDKPVTPDNNNSNNRGNRGGFDMNGYMDRLKERMAASEDEWKVIQPKLQKVMDARRETMSSMFGGFRRRGSDNNSSDNSKQSAVEQASKELRDVLDNKDAKPEEINAKLTAYREARNKARETLASAQKDLKDVLSARQEAVLVSSGMLD
jgi:Spy/CpxP family protein refolding chaperone